MSIKPTMSKDEMKAMLKAQLRDDPDMTIQEMMKSGLSRDTCYKMRRSIRAEIASAISHSRIPKEVVSSVIGDITSTTLSAAKIAKKHGIGETKVLRIARAEGINMRRRARHNSRKDSASNQGLSDQVKTSMTGDGFSLEWLTRSWC